jgi:Family of unknown function (DUF6368)
MKIWQPSICLIAAKCTKKDKQKIRNLLKNVALISDETERNYQFFVKKGKTLGLDLKEDLGRFMITVNDVNYEKNELPRKDLITNWRNKPAAYIEFYLTNNHQIHYLFIALLALELHKFLGGYFSFSEIITPLNNIGINDDFTKKIRDVDMNLLQTIKGEIHEIRLPSVQDVFTSNHYCICNEEWLQNWFLHNGFHLIK